MYFVNDVLLLNLILNIILLMNKVILLIFISLSFAYYGCAGSAATAEEYYSLGMAYYDLGKYDDAEKWLNRARQANRTMVASTYNLGRLAYERKRYDEAAKHFESILKRDPDNVMALKAAAYSRIQTGEIEKAEKHYSKLLQIVPESADDGYNHALVLFAMKRYSESEIVLERYPIALQENKDVMLLYARNQAAQNKVEAIDSFSTWLENHTDNKVRYEYAKTLEHHELYARALEEYRKAFSDAAAASADPKRYEIRFAIARVLLIADSASQEGFTELETAITEGFNDIAEAEKLLTIVNAANRERLRAIINNIRRPESEIESETNS